jgi:hypothetical protein
VQLSSQVSLQSHAFWKHTDDGLSNELGPGVGIDIRLASNVQFNIGTGYRDDPILRPYEDLKDSFTDKGENVFLIKLSYWLGI